MTPIIRDCIARLNVRMRFFYGTKRIDEQHISFRERTLISAMERLASRDVVLMTPDCSQSPDRRKL